MSKVLVGVIYLHAFFKYFLHSVSIDFFFCSPFQETPACVLWHNYTAQQPSQVCVVIRTHLRSLLSLWPLPLETVSAFCTTYCKLNITWVYENSHSDCGMMARCTKLSVNLTVYWWWWLFPCLWEFLWFNETFHANAIFYVFFKNGYQFLSADSTL